MGYISLMFGVVTAAQSLSFKDGFEIFSWLVGAVGVVIAVWKALQEARFARELRESELKWKKSNLAREVLKDMKDDEGLNAALMMIDYSDRYHQPSEDHKIRVTDDFVKKALRTANLSLTPDEEYIRASFDALLTQIQNIEHYVETDLLNFEDVRLFFDYYVTSLAEKRYALDLLEYIIQYKFHKVDKFLERFPEWRKVLRARGISYLREPDSPPGLSQDAVGRAGGLGKETNAEDVPGQGRGQGE